MNQSTLTLNSALGPNSSVGGISAANTTVYNCIVAGNSCAPSSPYPNVYPGLTCTGVNRTNGSPLLAPHGNYGGRTPTMPPLPGSPAINGCTSGTTFATDQRGQPRIVGAFADLGAVEGVFNPNYPLVNVTQLGSGNMQFAFTNLSGPNYTVLASTNVAAPRSPSDELSTTLLSRAGAVSAATTNAGTLYRLVNP